MSILRPTTGQIIDRLAALTIKRDRFAISGKEFAHLGREADEIMERIPITAFPKELAELIDIHSRMWDLVDIVGDSTDMELVAKSAKELHGKNLDRHRVVAAIDMAGGEFVGDEKL